MTRLNTIANAEVLPCKPASPVYQSEVAEQPIEPTVWANPVDSYDKTTSPSFGMARTLELLRHLRARAQDAIPVAAPLQYEPQTASFHLAPEVQAQLMADCHRSLEDLRASYSQISESERALRTKQSKIFEELDWSLRRMRYETQSKLQASRESNARIALELLTRTSVTDSMGFAGRMIF